MSSMAPDLSQSTASPAKRIARMILWPLVTLGTVAWLLIVCTNPWPWYSDNMARSKWAAYMAVDAKMPGPDGDTMTLVWGSTNIWEVTLLSTTVLVAWCAAALMMIADKTAPSSAEASAPTLGTRIMVQVRRVLAYQLPPHKLWVRATGGLSVQDACVLGFFLGLDAIWLAATFISLFHKVDGFVDQGTFRQNFPQYTIANIKTDFAALSFAWAIIPQIVCIMYPVPRSSFLHWVFGTEMPRIIKYHRWLGHLLLWNVSLHGLLRYVGWWMSGNMVSQAFLWNDSTNVNNLAGTIAWVIGGIVWATSTNWVRRHYYQVFYATHCLGITLFMLFSFAHYPPMVIYSLAGWSMYLLDLALRLVQRFCNTSTAVCTIDEQAQVLTIRLTFDKEVTVLPTQYLYIKFPTVNIYQRHPFSIASISRDFDTKHVSVAVHVKALGPWTKQLQAASSGQVPVVVDGPYGSTCAKWRTAEVLVLFAGGIGATSILSILEDIMVSRTRGKPAPSFVYFVWMSRNVSEFRLLAPDVLMAAASWPHTLTGTSTSNDWLQVQLCDTSKEGKEVVVGAQVPSAKELISSRPLRSYGYGYAFYCVAILLSCLGGYAAMLPSQAYQAWGLEYMGASGYWSWVAGVTYGVSLLLGVMLPPVLLAAWVHAYQALARRLAVAADPDDHEALPQASCSLPTDYMAKSARDLSAFRGDIEALTYQSQGHQMVAADQFVKRGRPDIARILADVREKHAATLEVLVYASGPKAMCRSVRDECQAPSGAPYMDCHMLSFSL